MIELTEDGIETVKYTLDEVNDILRHNDVDLDDEVYWLIGLDFDVVVFPDGQPEALTPSEIRLYFIEGWRSGVFQDPGVEPVILLNAEDGPPVTYELLSALHPVPDKEMYIISPVRYTHPEDDSPTEGTLGDSRYWARSDVYHEDMPKFESELDWPDKRKEDNDEAE